MGLHRNQRHQQITQVGNRRVTQQTLDVGLADGHQVAEQNRTDGNDRQHHAQRFVVGSRRIQEQTHNDRKDSNLAGGGQEG
ncbi:hypothetical protein D3C71_1416430 [compost metagenome]